MLSSRIEAVFMTPDLMGYYAADSAESDYPRHCDEREMADHCDAGAGRAE
jgi:hypothetical protein